MAGTSNPSPWAEGDCPHGETLDLDEYPVALARLTKCRSFRADLRHKIEIIVRAAGGWHDDAVEGVCKRLHCWPSTLWRWYQWRNVPGSRWALETIDNAYSEALEVLAARAAVRQKKQAARNKKTPEFVTKEVN